MVAVYPTSARHDQTAPGFDPAAFTPVRHSDAQVFDRGADEPGLRFAVASDNSPGVELLSEQEKRLWDLMDGVRTVDDICLAYLQRHESLALSQVYSLLRRLWNAGLITDNPGFADVTATQRGRFALRNAIIRPLGIRLPGTGLAARAVHRLVAGRWIETRPAAVSLAAILVAGLFAAPSLQSRSLWQWSLPFELPRLGVVSESYIYGLALIVLLNMLCSLAREIWLTAMEGRYTGRFDDLRFGIFPWVPCFHHVRKWRQVLPVQRRILVGLSPMLFELLGASFCAFLLRTCPCPAATELLFKLMAVLCLRTFLHLAPFPGCDLPAILGESGDLGDIETRAIGFLRHSFAESFLFRTKRSRQHWFFLAYILGAVAWLAAFAGIASWLIPDGFAISAVVGEGQTGVLLTLALFAIPVLLAVGLTVVWGLFFLWRFLAYHPFFQDPNYVLSLAALALCAVVIAIETAPLRRQPILLSAASAVIMLAGAVLTYRFVFRTHASTLSTQLSCIGLALLCGGTGMINGAVWQSLNLSLVAEIWLFLFLVPPLAISFARQQHVVLADQNDFRFPYLLAMSGFALLAMVNAGNFVYVNIENPAMKAMPWNTLLAYSLIPLALVTFHLHLKHVTSTAPILILKDTNAGDPQVLTRIVAAVRNAARAMLVQKFGDGCVCYLEQAGTPRLGTAEPAPLPVLEPGESVEDLWRELRRQITHLDRALCHYFGAEFSDLVFNRALSAVNYEAQVLLQRRVLHGTRFSWSIADERALDPSRCAALVNDIGFFQALSDEDRCFLVQHMTLKHFPPNDKLIRRGDRAEVCFILVDGKVQVEEIDLCGERRIIAFMTQGDLFGESALLDGGRRIADVRAVAPTTALALYRHDFMALAARRPEMVARITEHLQTLHFLFSVRLFADLPTHLLRAVVPRFTVRTYDEGETIFSRGEIGDTLYIIQSGAVAVLDETNGRERKVRDLKQHDYFGEIALLRSCPRTMTVRAVAHTRVLMLATAHLKRLLHSSKLFTTNIERVGEERLSADRLARA